MEREGVRGKGSLKASRGIKGHRGGAFGRRSLPVPGLRPGAAARQRRKRRPPMPLYSQAGLK